MSPDTGRRKFPIKKTSAAIVLNDMINGNLHTGNEEHDAKIRASGIIQASAKLVERARDVGIPVVWIRVERRADRTDVFDSLTDAYIAGGCKPKPPTVHGSHQAEQAAELPVLTVDQVVLKPRTDPFVGTDLELRLRGLGVDTILLGGVSTNHGVESIARSAKDRNFHVVLLKDCAYNVDHEAHEWTLKHIMPGLARVMTSVEALEILE